LGSRNRATEIAEALMEGEAPAVTRTLVERARAGSSAAMRLYFERVVPPRRERAVRGRGGAHLLLISCRNS